MSDGKSGQNESYSGGSDTYRICNDYRKRSGLGRDNTTGNRSYWLVPFIQLFGDEYLRKQRFEKPLSFQKAP